VGALLSNADQARANITGDQLVLGHRLMAQGKYDMALSAYMRALARQGATADVLSAMGSADLKLGRLKPAEELLRKATEKDGRFVAAWNNLGVVLMGEGMSAEALRVFKVAFALDKGRSQEIRRNLQLAIAKTDQSAYHARGKNKFVLVRRGGGRYILLRTPATKNGQ